MIRLNYWSYVTCTACLHQPVYCYWSYHVIIIRKVVRCMISCFDHCACRLMLSLEFSFLILQSSSCWVDVNCINHDMEIGLRVHHICMVIVLTPRNVRFYTSFFTCPHSSDQIQLKDSVSLQLFKRIHIFSHFFLVFSD